MQHGEHRPYVAATLLGQWYERIVRRDGAKAQADLQDHLFDWLDVGDTAQEPGNLKGIATTFGKLVKADLFSYASYLERLIARGECGLSMSEVSVLEYMPQIKITTASRLQSQDIAALCLKYHFTTHPRMWSDNARRPCSALGLGRPLRI